MVFSFWMGLGAGVNNCKNTLCSNIVAKVLYFENKLFSVYFQITALPWSGLLWHSGPSRICPGGQPGLTLSHSHTPGSHTHTAWSHTHLTAWSHTHTDRQPGLTRTAWSHTHSVLLFFGATQKFDITNWHWRTFIFISKLAYTWREHRWLTTHNYLYAKTSYGRCVTPGMWATTHLEWWKSSINYRSYTIHKHNFML